jgi:hypothetical protein
VGILDFFMGIQNPVDAEYTVTACTRRRSAAPFSSCSMRGIIHVAGMPPREMQHDSPLTPRDKWPVPGQVLPVIVDRDDPYFLRVKWEKIAAVQPPTATD